MFARNCYEFLNNKDEFDLTFFFVIYSLIIFGLMPNLAFLVLQISIFAFTFGLAISGVLSALLVISFGYNLFKIFTTESNNGLDYGSKCLRNFVGLLPVFGAIFLASLFPTVSFLVTILLAVAAVAALGSVANLQFIKENNPQPKDNSKAGGSSIEMMPWVDNESQVNNVIAKNSKHKNSSEALTTTASDSQSNDPTNVISNNQTSQ